MTPCQQQRLQQQQQQLCNCAPRLSAANSASNCPCAQNSNTAANPNTNGNGPTVPAACGTSGRPSPDGKLRVYTQLECATLTGTWLSIDGECLMPAGGSFSTACAVLNTLPAASPSSALAAGGAAAGGSGSVQVTLTIGGRPSLVSQQTATVPGGRSVHLRGSSAGSSVDLNVDNGGSLGESSSVVRHRRRSARRVQVEKTGNDTALEREHVDHGSVGQASADSSTTANPATSKPANPASSLISATTATSDVTTTPASVEVTTTNHPPSPATTADPSTTTPPITTSGPRSFKLLAVDPSDESDLATNTTSAPKRSKKHHTTAHPVRSKLEREAAATVGGSAGSGSSSRSSGGSADAGAVVTSQQEPPPPIAHVLRHAHHGRARAASAVKAYPKDVLGFGAQEGKAAADIDGKAELSATITVEHQSSSAAPQHSGLLVLSLFTVAALLRL